MKPQRQGRGYAGGQAEKEEPQAPFPARPPALCLAWPQAQGPASCPRAGRLAALANVFAVMSRSRKQRSVARGGGGWIEDRPSSGSQPQSGKSEPGWTFGPAPSQPPSLPPPSLLGPGRGLGEARPQKCEESSEGLTLSCSGRDAFEGQWWRSRADCGGK